MKGGNKLIGPSKFLLSTKCEERGSSREKQKWNKKAGGLLSGTLLVR